MTALKVCSMKSRFCLYHRSMKGTKWLSNEQYVHISLQCQHDMVFRGKQKLRENVSKTKCSRSSDKNVTFGWIYHCTPLVTNVISNSELKKDRLKVRFHNGHFCMNASHLHTHIYMLPAEEMLLTEQYSQLNMTNSNVAALLNVQKVLD